MTRLSGTWGPKRHAVPSLLPFLPPRLGNLFHLVATPLPRRQRRMHSARSIFPAGGRAEKDPPLTSLSHPPPLCISVRLPELLSPPLSPFKEGQSPEYKCKLRGREERKKETSLEVVCRSGVDGQSVRRKKGSCHTRSCVYTRERGRKDFAGGEP